MRTLFRAEPGYLKVYELTRNQSMDIYGDYLTALAQWLNSGEINDFVLQLNKAGFIQLPMEEREKEEIKNLLTRTKELKAPHRAMCTPEIMNIELTTRCPLRCPQCYCDLHKGKDIDKETALKYIEQAADLQIPYINLSGGETLVYPYLMELLQLISVKGLSSAVAISGWGFDSAMLNQLKNAGVNEIYVSLNGSTEEINAISRDAYKEAIAALRLLQDDGQVAYYINWVARNDNILDFPDLVNLARSYGAKGIVILESKPDASYVLQASLSEDNFLFLADYIKNHDQKEILIIVEPCFSPLRAYISKSFFGNRNTGFNKGCGAGRNAMAVDVDGNLIPCRHLLYPEKFEYIEDYWQNSEVLHNLRSFEDKKEEPCQSCALNQNCISCRAVADKVENNIYSGNNYCPVGRMKN